MDGRADRAGIRGERAARAAPAGAADRAARAAALGGSAGSRRSRASRCSGKSSWCSSASPCSRSTCRAGSRRRSRCRSTAARSCRRSGAAPSRRSRAGSGRRRRRWGCARWQQLRLVILPQALTIAIPPTVGFLVQLIKNTSLASIIGLVELSREAQLVNGATFAPFAGLWLHVAALFRSVLSADHTQPPISRRGVRCGRLTHRHGLELIGIAWRTGDAQIILARRRCASARAIAARRGPISRRFSTRGVIRIGTQMDNPPFGFIGRGRQAGRVRHRARPDDRQGARGEGPGRADHRRQPDPLPADQQDRPGDLRRWARRRSGRCR